MAAKSNDKCSVETIEKKLTTFNNTQDSVQALSMWIMHNRSYHQRIVDTWLKVLKKSDTKHKLTLFYLCNDVVQHAKRKKALYYLENFKDNLREAVMHVRDADKIKPNIERVLNIWEQRKTYDVKFILELRRILSGDYAGNSSKDSSAKSTPVSAASPLIDKKKKNKEIKKKTIEELEKEPEIPEKEVEETEEVFEEMAEFKPPAFIEEVTTLRQTEMEVTLKAKQLTMMRIDATNVDAVKQLKDRSHGADFCKQFEESCIKIEDYVGTLEKEIRERKIVVAHCDQAESFYEEQFKEAKIVATAYKNYGARITNMKKRVDDMKKIIPATPSPVPSPSADAPSPGNTPVLPEMDDNDMVDMELCEEGAEESRKQKGTEATNPGRAYTAMVKSIPQPIPSLTDITIGDKESDPVQIDKEKPASPEATKPAKPTQTFQGSNVLESRIANMLPNLAKGSSSIGINMPVMPGNILEDYSTPNKTQEPEPADDRASTPVQDEQEEKVQTPVKVSQPSTTKSTSVTKVKTNPIDFLSQLLTKTSSTSSSSNFLHSLSLLTNTVKSQHQKKAEVNNDATTQSKEPSSPPTSDTQLAFTGVPAPEPVTQSSSWPEWKNINTPALSEPSLPHQAKNPSPPVMTPGPPPKFPPPQPPLPQHPPPPLNVPPPQSYPVQPPSPQDFSMPPPVSQTFARTPVSQTFLTPPPLSQFNQIPPAPQPPHNAVVNSPAPLAINPVSPTQLQPQRSQFNQVFPFGTQNTVTPVTPTEVAPPPNSGIYPPPSQSVAPPPPWQQENMQESASVPTSSFNNRIATVPSRRGTWDQIDNSEYDPEGKPWDNKTDTRENQNSGYAHPWEQPQNYEEEEEEEDSNRVIAPPKTRHAAPKGILRNSRSSSLREVTLVDDSEDKHDQINSVSAPVVPPVVKPIGILKKPPTDVKSVDHVGDVQSEFIAKLKQKSSGSHNVTSGPPNSRTLTAVHVEDLNVKDSNSISHDSEQGEHISTIGVLGSVNCANSVKSDDMDIDNAEDEGNIEVNNENEWVDNVDSEEWQEERQGYISRDYDLEIPPGHSNVPPVHQHDIPVAQPRFEEHERVPPLHDVPGIRPRFETPLRLPEVSGIRPRFEAPPLHEVAGIRPRFGGPPLHEVPGIRPRFEAPPLPEVPGIRPRFEAPPSQEVPGIRPRFQAPQSQEIPGIRPRFDTSPLHEVPGVRPRFDAPPMQEVSGLRAKFEETVPAPPRPFSYEQQPYSARPEYPHPFQDHFRGPPPAKRPFYPPPGLRMPYYRY